MQTPQLFDGATRLIFQIQRFLDSPFFRFTRLVGKGVYFFGIMIKTTISFIISIIVLMITWKMLDALSEAEDNWNIWRAIRDFLFETPYGEKATGLPGNLQQLFVDRWWYDALVLIMIILIARRVLHRLRLKDDRGNIRR